MTKKRKTNDLGKCTLRRKHLILMLSGYGGAQTLLKLLPFKIHKGRSYYGKALLPVNPSDRILREHLPVWTHAVTNWMLLTLLSLPCRKTLHIGCFALFRKILS